MMDETFNEEFQDFCQPYIDDLIIFSKTFEEHIEHISKVLDRLISMQKRKIDAIKKMGVPRKSAEVKRFVAMAGYYRKFIKNFASRTHHLGLITRDKSSFEWTEPHQREFDDIKEALMSDPVMAYPDWNKQFILTTDASYSGPGAVLSQQFPEGERVIVYASRRLQGSENNYPITQLEALAVVWAVELFRDPYLADKQFKLITDHRALLKFQNMQTESNCTLQRWSMSSLNITWRLNIGLGRI
jgi:hypothetical protein